MDKNQALINYLLTCEPIRNSPLYFNLASIKSGVTQLIPLTQDKAINTSYIDGSVDKKYSLTVVTYLSITPVPVVKVAYKPTASVIDFGQVQQLINWVEQQEKEKCYPDFGIKCPVTKISVTSENPRTDQIDMTLTPPLAKYSFTIEVFYTDKSDVIWK